MSKERVQYNDAAFSKQEFETYLDETDKLVLLTNWVELRILVNVYSFRIINYEEIKEDFPFLQDFVDFKIIEDRSYPIAEPFDEFKRFDILTFVPELVEITNRILETVKNIPRSIQKAEAWYRGHAMHFSLDSSLESLIYFYKCFDISFSKESLLEDFRVEANRRIERDTLYNKNRKNIINKAAKRKLSVFESVRLLEFNGSRPRLLGFYDNEEDFIDATFVRTIECLELSGFDQYVQDFIDDIVNTYQNDIDQVRSSLFMFNLCRSDAIIQRGSPISLEALLQIFAVGSIDKKKPWRVNGYPWARKAKVIRNVDYVIIAGVIVFSWVRIGPTSLNITVFENSIDFIFGTQLDDGSWPLLSHLKTGDLLTTAISIHALCVAKPVGWKDSVDKARLWLVSQMNEIGCWTIQGAPEMYFQAFCLEAVRLADSKSVSFTVNDTRFAIERTINAINPSTGIDTIVLCEGSVGDAQNSQFDARCYRKIFSTKYPNVLFYSAGNCEDVINDKMGLYKALTTLFPHFSIIRIVDRDDMNDSEVSELRKGNIKVLTLRNIESYLLNDEVLKKICDKNLKIDFSTQLLTKKEELLNSKIELGFQPDDLKKIASDLYLYLKKEFKLTREGKTQRAFMRDYVSPLITEDMKIYKELEKDIFF